MGWARSSPSPRSSSFPSERGFIDPGERALLLLVRFTR